MSHSSKRTAIGLSLIVYTISTSSNASETATHQYDALGRLAQTSKSGGSQTGAQTTTTYDPAGNRANQTTTGASGSGGGTPPPPPPPPPPPSNQPPVANPNSLSAPKCVTRSVNVIANDTDPDGHIPLTLTAVNQPWATVDSSTTVGMFTPETNGTYTITYTVSDTLGATATGILTVTISGSQQCN